LSLTLQKVKNWEAIVPTCTHGELFARITELQQHWECRIPIYKVKVTQ
jgi:hypothetical protein